MPQDAGNGRKRRFCLEIKLVLGRQHREGTRAWQVLLLIERSPDAESTRLHLGEQVGDLKAHDEVMPACRPVFVQEVGTDISGDLDDDLLLGHVVYCR